MKNQPDPKQTRKMECPCCHSTNLELAGVEMDMENIAQAGEGYKCLACGKFFLFRRAA